MDYFIADLHLGHKNCLSFDNRPFKTIEEQDEFVIKNWNKRITCEDDVYILGDVSWYDPQKTCEIFYKLNGKLHLLVGNHDKKLIKNKDFLNCFCEVKDYIEMSLPKRKTQLVLCHYPIPCFNKHYYGAIHFYGHVHSGFEWNMMEKVKQEMTDLYDTPCRMFNVGAMMSYIGYIPRTLEDILIGGERGVRIIIQENDENGR